MHIEKLLKITYSQIFQYAPANNFCRGNIREVCKEFGSTNSDFKPEDLLTSDIIH